MELTIGYEKKEIFMSIFSNLKNFSTIIAIVFKPTQFYSQGLDKSQVCMFDLTIQNEWFNLYDVKKEITIYIDSITLYKILNLSSTNNYNINMSLNKDNLDLLNIKFFLDNMDCEKEFSIPLIDCDYQFLKVNKNDYTADFKVGSKNFHDIISQLLSFGNQIKFICNSDNIIMNCNGDCADMKVNLIDFEEYTIDEGENIDVTYNLNNMNKMCLNPKISPIIEIYISNDLPLKINYNIGNRSNIIFFAAPTITDV